MLLTVKDDLEMCIAKLGCDFYVLVQCFSVVVGPNGSGKSIVIDAFFFVSLVSVSNKSFFFKPFWKGSLIKITIMSKSIKIALLYFPEISAMTSCLGKCEKI